jgi:hypothetical protein
MGSLVHVHNDGPDAVEIRLGRRSILLQAGQDFRVSTAAHTVEVVALQGISAEDLALHMGGRPHQGEVNRYAED